LSFYFFLLQETFPLPPSSFCLVFFEGGFSFFDWPVTTPQPGESKNVQSRAHPSQRFAELFSVRPSPSASSPFSPVFQFPFGSLLVRQVHFSLPPSVPCRVGLLAEFFQDAPFFLPRKVFDQLLLFLGIPASSCLHNLSTAPPPLPP